MPRYDVTVYSPATASLWNLGRTAGAERQMLLLAEELGRRGYAVALVVYPVEGERPEPPRGATYTIVERSRHPGGAGLIATLKETARVVRSLARADSSVVVVRTGTPVVGAVGLYCRLRRRKLVFSAANDFDFTEREGPDARRRWLYRLGVRLASAIVVQSKAQVDLARAFVPSQRRIVRIPSFADVDAPDTTGPADAFVWVNRLARYKDPLLYADLAAAVPEAQFVLVPNLFPGEDEDEPRIAAELAAAADRLENLTISEPLPFRRVLERVSTATALVSTSSAEGMPNTFLEAWSLGVPVLTLSFDPDDVITEYGLGVAAGGSWERFVEGARTLSSGRLDRDEMSRRVRAYVRDAHSVTAVGDRWRELLDELGVAPAEGAVEGVDTDPGST